MIFWTLIYDSTVHNMQIIDSIAGKLLTYINLNASKKLTTICREVGIPAQRGHYLMKKFRTLGLVKKRTFLDLSRIGIYQFTIYCSLSFQSTKQREGFMDELSKEPTIVEVYELTGAYNTGLVFYATNPLEVHQTWRRVLARFHPTVHKSSLTVRARNIHLQRRIFFSKPINGFLPVRRD